MDLDTSAVTTVRVLKTLAFYRKVWWAGWVLFAVAVLIASHFMALAAARADQIDALATTRREMFELQSNYAQSVDNLSAAWKQQQQYGDLLIAWGDFVKERSKLATPNLQAVRTGQVRSVR